MLPVTADAGEQRIVHTVEPIGVQLQCDGTPRHEYAVAERKYRLQ